MNAAAYGLAKNLSLLFLVGFTGFIFLYDRLEDWAVLCIQAALGLAYFLFSIAEAIKTRQATIAGEKRFFYLTNGTLAKKAIRTGALLMCSLILFLSYSRLQEVAIVIFIMLVSELIVFILRLKLMTYFISIREKSILINADKETKVFASQITVIDYRHDIFHLTKDDRRVQQIELEKLKADRRAEFTGEFTAWCKSNGLHFTNEAKEKLGL